MPYQYKREPLPSTDVDKLLNACKDLKEKLVVYTLLDTGMRVSELTSLKKDQIHWQEKRIVLFGKGGPYGKKTKRRVVPMSERVNIAMQSWFTLQDKLDLTDRAVQYMVKRIANRAGVIKKVTPHVLRHTFAVNCIQKGISTRALQMFLGHDRLGTTEIYLNMSPEDALREFRDKW